MEGRGPLTRPELAVLLATAKNRLKRSLLEAVNDPTLAAVAADAFPASLRNEYASEIDQHRLRPQLVATQLANALVHYLGITVTHRLEHLAGTDSLGVAKAFQVARICFDLDRRWAEVEQLPATVDVEIRRELLLRLSALMRRTTRWLLRRHGDNYDVGDMVQRYRQSLQELAAGMGDWLTGIPKQHFDANLSRWVHAGVPDDIATFLAGTPSLTGGPSVVEAALAANQSMQRTTQLYLALGEQLRLHDFARFVNGLSVRSSWEARARDGFRDDIDRAYQAFAAHFAKHSDIDVNQQVKDWTDSRPVSVAQWFELIEATEEAGDRAYPVLAVAGRTLAQLPDAQR